MFNRTLMKHFYNVKEEKQLLDLQKGCINIIMNNTLF